MSVRSLSLFLGTALLVIAGCAGAGRLQYDTPEEAFQRGKELYDNGKYERSIEYFQAVFNFGRTHEWADDAQLYLGRAYLANGEYLFAANELGRFSEIYRTDPRRAEAEYERAGAYYRLSPPYQLDQTDTHRAIREYQLFLQRFPESTLVSEAETRIQELREKLARKEISAAEQYARREQFEAAALQYASAFDKFPDTQWADDALLGAMQSYLAYADQSIRASQAERLLRAVDHYERLVQLFPDSPLLDEARAVDAEVRERLRALDETEAALAGGR